MSLIRQIYNDSQEIIGDVSSEEEIIFIHSVLGLCSLPYAALPPGTIFYKKEIGRMSIRLNSGAIDDIQQPIAYGRKPRILQIVICSQAIKNKSPLVCLSDSSESMYSFIKGLGYNLDGFTYNSFRKALMSLCASNMQISFKDGNSINGFNTFLIKQYELYFSENPKQLSFLDSKIILSDDFFNNLLQHSIPLSGSVIKSLRSSRAYDIYIWLNYRLRYLQKPTSVSYQSLQYQFSSPNTNMDTFKRQFKKALREVLNVYDSARVEEARGRLILYPSRSSVKQLK